jgi:hypothetical protein
VLPKLLPKLLPSALTSSGSPGNTAPPGATAAWNRHGAVAGIPVSEAGQQFWQACGQHSGQARRLFSALVLLLPDRFPGVLTASRLLPGVLTKVLPECLPGSGVLPGLVRGLGNNLGKSGPYPSRSLRRPCERLLGCVPPRLRRLRRGRGGRAGPRPVLGAVAGAMAEHAAAMAGGETTDGRTPTFGVLPPQPPSCRYAVLRRVSGNFCVQHGHKGTQGFRQPCCATARDRAHTRAGLMPSSPSLGPRPGGSCRRRGAAMAERMAGRRSPGHDQLPAMAQGAACWRNLPPGVGSLEPPAEAKGAITRGSGGIPGAAVEGSGNGLETRWRRRRELLPEGQPWRPVTTVAAGGERPRTGLARTLY